MPTDQSERRARWETQWRSKEGPEFAWYVSEAPPQLVDTLQKHELPDGDALDLGCGSGVASLYLAGHFRLVVGVDFSFAAVQRAGSVAIEEKSGACFVAAEVPRLPFDAGAFAFIFDRGCLQGMPKELWPAYFVEVERLLKAGGLFQLMTSKPEESLIGVLAGIRARFWSIARGRAAGSGKREFISDAAIAHLLPGSMSTVLLEHFPFRMANGMMRDFTHGIFRKS